MRKGFCKKMVVHVLCQWKRLRLLLGFGCVIIVSTIIITVVITITLSACSLSGTLLAFSVLYVTEFSIMIFILLMMMRCMVFYEWGNWGLENFSSLYRMTDFNPYFPDIKFCPCNHSALVERPLCYRKDWHYPFLALWLCENHYSIWTSSSSFLP